MINIIYLNRVGKSIEFDSNWERKEIFGYYLRSTYLKRREHNYYESDSVEINGDNMITLCDSDSTSNICQFVINI